MVKFYRVAKITRNWPMLVTRLVSSWAGRFLKSSEGDARKLLEYCTGFR